MKKRKIPDVIAVINKSGNSGKSMLTNQVLKTRITNSKVIAVETINDDGTDNEKLRGDQFDKILDDMLEYPNVIIDIGSSNIEDFLEKMAIFSGTEDDIGLFIIPVVNTVKIINDSISMIQQLSAMGIERERIVVVFNMVKPNCDIRHTFEQIGRASCRERV